MMDSHNSRESTCSGYVIPAPHSKSVFANLTNLMIILKPTKLIIRQIVPEWCLTHSPEIEYFEEIRFVNRYNDLNEVNGVQSLSTKYLVD
jgi:hypothetical protein